MDEFRRRRSFWFDRRQSRSEGAPAAEPRRRSFILNGSQSFLRRFLCASDGLAWQLQPISPEYVPLPRYSLLSRSATETFLSDKPGAPPESRRGNGRGGGGWKPAVVGRVAEMKTGARGNNYQRNDDNVEGGGDEGGAELQSARRSVKKGKKWRSWLLPDPQRRWPVQGW